MSGEGPGDLFQYGFADDACAAEVAAGLFHLATGQVAGAGLAVLGLAAGGESEPLLSSFMSLLLWHRFGPVQPRKWRLSAWFCRSRKALQYRDRWLFAVGAKRVTQGDNERFYIWK